MNKVQISNLALRRIGEQTIMSFDDDTKNADVINLIFDPVVEQVLTAFNWNCATYRAKLAETTDSPPFGYAHSYELPKSPKCLRVIRMSDPRMIFRIEGGLLLTNEPEANILYIGKPDDFNTLDALCCKVLYLSLAVEMAYTMVEQNTILNGLYDQLKDALADAWQMNSHEGTPEIDDYNEWLSSRFAGVGYNLDRTIMN